jgi:dolichol-phosphate mannosyltransferase
LKSVVVIPTYNEAENLPKMVSALFSLPQENLNLLIVDDSSPDGTGKIADDLKALNPRIDVMHRQGKLGLGSAYVQGFQKALTDGADIICQMDCDFSHDPKMLPVLIKAVTDGGDVVVGSRYAPGGKLDETWPFWRKALSWFGNYYARTILGLQVRDVTAGFKAWRKEILTKMPLNDIKSNGYVFQVEMIYAATRLGAKVTEIPIYFADRKFGKSKMSFKIQIEAAVRVWKLPGIHRHLSVEKGAQYG